MSFEILEYILMPKKEQVIVKEITKVLEPFEKKYGQKKLAEYLRVIAGVASYP